MADTKIEKVETKPLGAPAPTPTIEMIIATAVEQKLPVAELRELVALKREMDADRHRQAFNAAFMEFQQTCPIIRALHETTQYQRATKDGRRAAGRYAAEDDIRPIVNPVMGRCGLSISFPDHEFDEAGHYILHYELRHKDGHILRGKGPPIDAAKAVVSREGKVVQSPPQVSSSTNTYARRITTINALGLTTTDDDDGRGEQPAETITDDQVRQIEGLLNEIHDPKLAKAKRAKLLEHIEGTVLADCPAAKLDRVVENLQQTLQAQAKP